MYRTSLTTLGISALLSVAAVAYAQEQPSSEVPAPPAEISQEEQDWEQRIARSDGFRVKMLQTSRGMELFSAFVEKNRNEVMANRKKCREDLRRANRDTRFSTTVHCFGKEHQLNTELAEKKKQFAETVSGVTEELRAEALTSLDALLDAMNAVSTGIERGVLRTEEELLEAKQNLHKNYRMPALIALSHLDADRTLSWVAHLMVRLLISTQNTEMGPEAFAKAAEALGCYEEGEGYLESVLASQKYEDALYAASQSRSHLALCGELLEDAHTLQRDFEYRQQNSSEDQNY